MGGATSSRSCADVHRASLPMRNSILFSIPNQVGLHSPYQPLPRSLHRSTVISLSRFSHLVVLTTKFARGSCSPCATKGGTGRMAPIYGVLSLDPSRFRPLQLLKSRDAFPVRGDGIVLCVVTGTSVVNTGAGHKTHGAPAEDCSQLCVSAYEGVTFAQTQEAANPGVQVVL